jgi:hypothetical protein
LGRLGARIQIDGNHLLSLPPNQIWIWFEKLNQINWASSECAGVRSAFAQMAEYLGEPSVDLSEQQRQEIAKKLRGSGAPAVIWERVLVGKARDTSNSGSFYAEDLPMGLRLAPPVNG